MSNKLYRQGDVLLVPVASLPEGLHKTKTVTAAFGEVTGHHHTIFEGAVGFATDKVSETCKFIQVVEDVATLKHQEHDPINLPQGNYEVFIQTEYTPEAIRNVAD